MLLADLKQPFESPQHIAELKLDGIRAVLEVDDRVKMYTRHQNDISSRFTEVTSAAASAVLPGTTLDGELIISDLITGKPDFEAMMSRFQTKKVKQRTPGLTFVAFDILRYKGEDLRAHGLMERKEILHEALQENDVMKRIRFMEHSFISFFELCKQQKLEGIVIKKRDSKYYSGRRPKDIWQRVVVYEREKCVILGYSKRELAWLVGVERNGQLEPAGVVKYGLTEERRNKAFPIMVRHQTHETKDYVYIKPMVEATVRFRHWTKAGKMRLAVLEDVHL
ncbi:DNA ligase [Paenibacillus campinasensis]|nr:DNA ligase [Paenibacillus campinasensis]